MTCLRRFLHSFRCLFQSMDCTDWLFWRTKLHTYSRCQTHDKGVCPLGSDCKNGHVFRAHSEKHVLTCKPPTSRKEIEIMRANNIDGDYFYTAGYFDRTNNFVYSQGGKCRLFEDTSFPETGIYWYETTKDQAIVALLDLFGEDAAAKFHENDSKLPLLNPKWLLEEIQPKTKEICQIYSKGLACLNGSRCCQAHVLDTSKNQFVPQISFKNGRLRVIAKNDSSGKRWFTSGFICANFVAYVKGGKEASFCPNTGLFWFHTENQAKNEMLGILRSTGCVSGLLL